MTDINDLQLMEEFAGAIDEVNEGADQQFFAPPSPPDDGKHRVKLSFGQDKIKLARKRQEGDFDQPTGEPYLKIALQGKPVDLEPGKPGFVLFDRVTSLKMPNAGTSRIRAILAKAGVPAPNRCTLAELKAHIESAIASEPIVDIVTQWQLSLKVGEKYYTVIKGQNNFPKGPDGKPLGMVKVGVTENPGAAPTFRVGDPDGQECRAQAVPVRYEAAE